MLPRLLLKSFANGKPAFGIAASKQIHTSSLCSCFFEPNRKGIINYDYKSKLDRKVIKEVVTEIPEQFSKFYQECRDHIIGTRKFAIPSSGAPPTRQFEFNSQEALNQWIVTSDSDNNQGYSEAKLVPSESGHAHFTGVINTRLPKDGKIKRAGYANMKSAILTKSFYRIDKINWTTFTHLVLRVRGDGRTYLVNLHTPGYFDITWLDFHSYPLFTRGGPYWQITAIPFTKFAFSYKGRAQDVQREVPLDDIQNVSISLMDNVDGPFNLEIDYIGCLYDFNHLADGYYYESYRTEL